MSFLRRSIRRTLVIALIPLSLLFSQTPPEEGGDDGLQETLGRLAEDAARSYVSPIVSGFGADLNSGWFHRAPWATMFGFDFEFGIVGMGALMDEEHRAFSFDGSFRFNYTQADQLAAEAATQAGVPSAQPDIRNAILAQDFGVNFSGPTIVGSKSDSLRLLFPGKTINVNGTDFDIPARTFVLPVTGLMEEAKIVPIAAPQVTIGTFLGSQFTFRYLPDIEISKEIGKFKYFGFGIQHNPLVWFGGEDALPFEVSASYFTQNMKVGTFLDANATAFGVNASIRLGWGFLNLTPYAGFLLESSKMHWSYDYEIETSPGVYEMRRIEFDLEGENSSRIVLGAAVKVLLFNVNVDMNFAKYRTISAGVMISI